MFNPFKKKETGFELDNSSLPSLGDMDDPFKSTDDNFSSNSLDSNSDTGLGNNSLGPEFGNQDTGLGDNSLPLGDSSGGNDMSSVMNMNNNSNGEDLGYSSPSFANNNNNFNNSNNQQSFNNMNNNSEQQSIHNDIVKTKIDSIESRIALMDARMQNMEQKLDMVYQLILSEVSPETKQKFQVNQSLNNRFR